MSSGMLGDKSKSSSNIFLNAYLFQYCMFMVEMENTEYKEDHFNRIHSLTTF